jgi:hypothetical protein
VIGFQIRTGATVPNAVAVCRHPIAAGSVQHKAKNPIAQMRDRRQPPRTRRIAGPKAFNQ